MKCLKCGAYVYSSDKFCRSCGTTLTQDSCQYGDNIANSKYDASSCHSKQYDYSTSYSNNNKETYTNYTGSYDYDDKYAFDYSKYTYAMPNDSGGEDKYVKAYIGKNYNAIKNMKFSLPGLLFGPLYLLYRKVWGYAIAMIIILIAAFALLSESTANMVNLLINIFIAFKFKEIYIKQAEEKTEHIQQQNLDKTTTELLEICKKKGGVATGKPLLIATIVSIFIIIAFVIAVVATIDYESEPYVEKESELKMTYTLPAGFVSKYQKNDYAKYEYTKADGNTCTIELNIIHTGTMYQDAATYLYNVYKSTNSYTYNPIREINLNDRTWNYKTVETNRVETGYATLDDEFIYSITTYHNKSYGQDIVECNTKYTEFLNSVKLQ